MTQTTHDQKMLQNEGERNENKSNFSYTYYLTINAVKHNTKMNEINRDGYGDNDDDDGYDDGKTCAVDVAYNVL